MTSYQPKLPSSSFLFLNNLNLTHPDDSNRYKAATRNTYKQEAWNMTYLVLLCKLWDMSNLPTPTAKYLFYGGIIGVLGSYLFLKASQKQVVLLSQLDSKYEQRCMEYLKEHGQSQTPAPKKPLKQKFGIDQLFVKLKKPGQSL